MCVLVPIDTWLTEIWKKKISCFFLLGKLFKIKHDDARNKFWDCVFSVLFLNVILCQYIYLFGKIKK